MGVIKTRENETPGHTGGPSGLERPCVVSVFGWRPPPVSVPVLGMSWCCHKCVNAFVSVSFQMCSHAYVGGWRSIRSPLPRGLCWPLLPQPGTWAGEAGCGPGVRWCPGPCGSVLCPPRCSFLLVLAASPPWPSTDSHGCSLLALLQAGGS